MTVTVTQATKYPYTNQLLELDRCRPISSGALTPQLQHIETPAWVLVWQESLQKHPDQQFTEYITHGLSHGFRIGFQHESHKLLQQGRNLHIADPQIVSDAIQTELVAQRLVELSPQEATALNIHCSPIGMIPRKNKPGKWRLIVDLSSLSGASVNDGISKDMCTLS